MENVEEKNKDIKAKKEMIIYLLDRASEKEVNNLFVFIDTYLSNRISE